MTSRSYNSLIAITVILALCLVGGPIVLRVVRQRSFDAALANSGAGLNVDGTLGDATVQVYGEVGLDQIDLIEGCGSIRRLEFFQQISSPQATNRILSLPGLEEIHIGFSLPDEAIACMCEHGQSVREISFLASGVSGRGLSRLSTLPVLGSLSFSFCKFREGDLILRGGFPSLKRLTIDLADGPAVSKVEVASLNQLEQLSLELYQALEPASALEVSTTDLANLYSLKVEINPDLRNATFSISKCPRLRRLAVSLRKCDSQILEEITLAARDLRQLKINAHGVLGPAEATALARMTHLESLELVELTLTPSLLTTIAEMPRLITLKLDDCEVVAEEGIEHDAEAARNGESNDQVDWFTEYVQADTASRSIGWAGAAKCSQLEELVFWSCSHTVDGLDWMKNLTHLRSLDLSRCSLNRETSPKRAPTSPPFDLDLRAKIAVGCKGYFPHVMGVCTEMQSLQELILSVEQIAEIGPTQNVGKLKIRDNLRIVDGPDSGA
jgi:hypothetical protein